MGAKLYACEFGCKNDVENHLVADLPGVKDGKCKTSISLKDGRIFVYYCPHVFVIELLELKQLMLRGESKITGLRCITDIKLDCEKMLETIDGSPAGSKVVKRALKNSIWGENIPLITKSFEKLTEIFQTDKNRN